MPLDFQKAFYIKLGKGGRWEADSIKNHRMRIGWKNVPLKLITRARWSEILRILKKSTADFNALRRISESSPEDIWITFYDSQLWWGRLARSQVRQDKISKYRRLKGRWQNRNLKGHLMTLDQIPGTLAKTQGFRGTACRIKEEETLRNLLLGKPSEAYIKLKQALSDTEKVVATAIQQLHWKDFETLVDLLFLSRTGWQRRSCLGGTMKGIDLELEDPLTRDVYHVQVKSSASLKDFKSFCQSRPRRIRRSYFVVHTPDKSLWDVRRTPKTFELIARQDLAKLVVKSGLVTWVEDRVRYSSPQPD